MLNHGVEILLVEDNASDARTRMIPVVMPTSSSEERDLVESYQLGVNSYIVKPVDFERFNEVARHLEHYWLRLNKQPASGSGSALETTAQPARGRSWPHRLAC